VNRAGRAGAAARCISVTEPAICGHPGA